MSRKCPLTGKGPMSGSNVSHSMRHTRRRWNVNLQNTTIVVDGKKVHVRISAAAMRTLRKNSKKAEAKKAAPAPVEAAPAAQEESK